MKKGVLYVLLGKSLNYSDSEVFLTVAVKQTMLLTNKTHLHSNEASQIKHGKLML